MTSVHLYLDRSEGYTRSRMRFCRETRWSRPHRRRAKSESATEQMRDEWESAVGDETRERLKRTREPSPVEREQVPTKIQPTNMSNSHIINRHGSVDGYHFALNGNVTNGTAKIDVNNKNHCQEFQNGYNDLESVVKCHLDVSVDTFKITNGDDTAINKTTEYSDYAQQNGVEMSTVNSINEDEHSNGINGSVNMSGDKNNLDDSLVSTNHHSAETPLHPGIRLSLFPNVPPYVRFSSHELKGEAFPPHIHKLLKWKLSTITPTIVRKVVSNSGFRVLKKSMFWCGTWGKHTKSTGFKVLYDYQKLNHFPGTFQIGRKDRLWTNLHVLMMKHGDKKFGFMPTTYVLPTDKKNLRLAWQKDRDNERWIVKPPASARGTGIKVVHKWNQIPKGGPVIVQKYITDPYLINGTKFDLRLYVLITSVHPLRIYLYDNGLVRFASVKYSSGLNTLNDRYMHLTNYSINKNSSEYTQNEDAEACKGHKWTLKSLWSYMEKELNVDVQLLWKRLVDLIIKTIISGEFSITPLTAANLNSRYNAYELFGIDVLIDENLKPWLLEVNISPSLHSSSPLDLAVKGPLVRDIMNMVGFQIPVAKQSQSQLTKGLGKFPSKCTRICYDKRLFTPYISAAEKLKHTTFVAKTRGEYLRSILENLTPDDIRHLIQYEDELTQLGSFQKIFPTAKSHEYLQYFDSPRYYNLLFDAWETRYHLSRYEGIDLLRLKCDANEHLNVSQVCFNACGIYKTRPKSKVGVRKQLSTIVDTATQCIARNLRSSQRKIAVNANPRRQLRPSLPVKRYQLRSNRR